MENAMTKSRILKTTLFFLTLSLNAASAHGQSADTSRSMTYDRQVLSWGPTGSFGLGAGDTMGGAGVGGGVGISGRLDLLDESLVLSGGLNNVGIRGFGSPDASGGGISFDFSALAGHRFTGGDCSPLVALTTNVDNGDRVGGGAYRIGNMDLNLGAGLVCYDGHRYYLGTLEVGGGGVLAGDGAHTEGVFRVSTQHVFEHEQDLLAAVSAAVSFMGDRAVTVDLSGAMLSLISHIGDDNSDWNAYWGPELHVFGNTEGHGGLALTLDGALRERAVRRAISDGNPGVGYGDQDHDAAVSTADSAGDDVRSDDLDIAAARRDADEALSD